MRTRLQTIAVKVLGWYVWGPGRWSYYGQIAAKATAWYIEQEAELLQAGRPLTADESGLARRMGVLQPGRVRVLVLPQFPFPADPMLAREAEAYGFGADREQGRSMGYAVLVKPRLQLPRSLSDRGGEHPPRWLLAHELVHVAQRERMGAAAFVRRYLLELKVFGYEYAPLENEANAQMPTE